ncbi:MAG: hypothetical protein ABI670_16860 [Chloroflexota bacterium]
MPLLRGETTRRIPGLGCAFGCLTGLLLGVLLTVAVSLMAARAIPVISQPTAGDAAVTVVVEEDYLNSEAAKKINGAYPTGIDGLTLTNLQLDSNVNNRLDMHADFRVDAGFINFDVNAGISNRISTQDGHMVMTMVGAPQLGDLNVPIDMLPFNLEDKIKSAVDYVNNNLIIEELNQTLAANLAGSNLDLDTVSTSPTALTLRLKQK